MSKKLINDKNGIEPGKEGYIETFELGTKTDTNDKESVPRSRLNKEIKKRESVEKKLEKIKEDQRKIDEANAEDDKTHKGLYETEKSDHDKTKKIANKWTDYSKKKREEIYKELELTDDEIEEWDEYSLKQVKRLFKKETSPDGIKVKNHDPASKAKKYKTREELATAYNNGEITEEVYEKEKKNLKRK